MLHPYFRRPHRTDDEPVEKEILHDAKAGLHGTKKVNIIIDERKCIGR